MKSHLTLFNIMRKSVDASALFFCSAVLLVPAAFGAPDRDNGIHWVAASDGEVPVKAVSAGTDQNGRQVYVCRISRSDFPSCTPFCEEMKTPGRLVEGDAFCAAELRGPTSSTQYEVLVSGNNSPNKAPRWVSPFTFPDMNNAIFAGVEVLPVNNLPTSGLSPSPNLICRVVDQSGFVGLGKRVGETRICQYISNDNSGVSVNELDFENKVEILIDPGNLHPAR